MKQKFSMIRDTEANQLILREYAELDKEALSLLCEERYDLSELETRMANGREDMKAFLRTRNFYPPTLYMERIMAYLETLFAGDGAESTEVFVSDLEFYNPNQGKVEVADASDEESDIDELLDETDDIDEEFSDDDIPSLGANASLKIADDESLDIDDDS